MLTLQLPHRDCVGIVTYSLNAIFKSCVYVCFSLAAIVVLFVALRRQKKEPLIVFEEEDIRENIITYDDEGGGEEDTEAFDIATLQVRRKGNRDCGIKGEKERE